MIDGVFGPIVSVMKESDKAILSELCFNSSCVSVRNKSQDYQEQATRERGSVGGRHAAEVPQRDRPSPATCQRCGCLC